LGFLNKFALIMARKDHLDAPKAKLNRQSFQKLIGIFRFMLPYRVYFGLGMLCLAFSSGLVLAFPVLMGQLVDSSLVESSLSGEQISRTTLILISILGVQAFFSFFRVWLFSIVTEKSLSSVRKALFDKFMHLPMQFYDSRRVGELMSRLTSDVSLLQDTFSTTLAEFFRQIVTLLGGITLLFLRNTQLTLFMLATFPILVLAGLIFGKFIRKMTKAAQDEQALSNTILDETLQTISMVKSYTNEAFENQRFEQSQHRAVSIALKAALYRSAFVSFIIFALFGGIVAVVWYGAQQVSSGNLSVGDLVSFVILTLFIGGSIGGLGDLFGSLQRAVGASERILEILDSPEETSQSGNYITQNKLGDIKFENVCFSYPSRKDVQVLKNISFSIQKGEKIALVGQSGAGKSTIVQLLLRLYHPDSGLIAADGQSISEYDLKFYRSKIGIVPQEIILFGGTIYENIAYGKIQASAQEVEQAARKAYAWEFISQFPQGLETKVGERGVKLSGGQRQRIAIARAILKDPDILILDEATNALDAESEVWVQKALEELMKNRTTIIIAHRLATIREADRILVVDSGQIVESGHHQELLENQNGRYFKLVNLQMES
jgi:ABC-type multidrug transport system fused ATPase/permease subunit